MKTFRSIITILLAAALIVSGTVVSFGASKTKTMTSYDQVIKNKSVAYCICGTRIVKVNLKNNKVTTIVKENKSIKAMKLYKDFIYYEVDAAINGAWLKRIKTNGKQKKYLTQVGWNSKGKTWYVISGSTIYYRKYDRFDVGPVYKMTLAGKNKKKASGISIKMTEKKINAKGYKVISKYLYTNDNTKMAYYDYRLQKPNGKKVYLGKSGIVTMW